MFFPHLHTECRDELVFCGISVVSGFYIVVVKMHLLK